MSLRSESASDGAWIYSRRGRRQSSLRGGRRLYTAAARHDYSDPWEDDELPSEQPWHRQLRGDNDGSGEYDEQSGYDPSEYDVTLGGDAHPAK